MSDKPAQLEEYVLRELESRGINPDTVISQLEMFRKGLPPVELARPCTLGDGIVSIEGEEERYARLFEEASGDKKIVKFVPASGAASRMFKELLAVLNRAESLDRRALGEAADRGDEEAEKVLTFINNLDKFAFFDDLRGSLENSGYDSEAVLADDGCVPEILEHLLLEKGLNYSNLPKGIIKFHSYPGARRTAFEEHLVEALNYTRDEGGRARAHFTVSPEHMENVKDHIRDVKGNYEDNGATLEINFSVQKLSTDTIAVDMDNRPILDEEGKPVFRPGGHGALIENLNDLDCDIVFIKNIDNVVPDRIKGQTYLYKKALGGYLIELERRVFSVLRLLDRGAPEDDVTKQLRNLKDMGIDVTIPKNLDGSTREEKTKFIRSGLMRPIRVCGVVKNAGEPGGGPFYVRGSGGSLSMQIVESAQVDMNSPGQKAVWESSTHFNPVDIVCGLRDYKGRAYNLTEYIDRDAGFITIKSRDGREFKALELPGLWNGSMAYWNSVFVEVPLITFNPVKTVFDLLRPEHQPG
ncbi:MAG: DUF4301 family protein [Deltaproteobacteria bacterium]